MSDDDKPSIAELQRIEQAMTGPRWLARPVDDVAELAPRIVCERDGCLEEIAAFESWAANEDTTGTAALRNAAPVLLEIAKAALAWRAMQERKLAHLYEPEEQALFDALAKVRP